MLVFDLPDYSKSSPAQNEKLARERQRREEGILQGPDIHAVSPLSRILPPSPRASRRFGVAVMSESEETQSGQLLMCRLRKRERERHKGRQRQRKLGGCETLLINDVFIYSTHCMEPFNHTCIWKKIKCSCEIKAPSTKRHPPP